MTLRLRRLAPIALAFALAAGAAGQLASQTPTPAPLSVLSRDGRRPLAVTLVGDREYVGVDDLASLFQLATLEDALGALTITYKGRTIVLTPDQALASVAGRLVSLPAPIAHTGRRWLVPPDFLTLALAPIYDARLDFRKASRLLIVGDLRVPRITVRYDTVAPGGRVTIDATPRTTSTVAQDADRLTIRFDADALDVASPPLAPPGPQALVQAVRVADATTLAVELGPRNAGARITSLPVDTTTRLTIDVSAADAPTQSGAPAAPPPVTPGPVTPPPPAPPELPSVTATASSAIGTVAIDPGHGGADEGAKGMAGAKEKDLTLLIARRLKATIEARLGIHVLLTRDDDRLVGVDERTATANNNKADLFISLHLNTSRKLTTSGAQIYYAGFNPPAEGALASSARAERLPTVGGGVRDIELVAWDLAQSRHVDQSMAFANLLAEQFRDRVPLAERAIDHAPLAVLKSANMPAVLLEIGFLSNSEQEAAIAGNDFQNALVVAITDAIVRFRDALGASR